MSDADAGGGLGEVVLALRRVRSLLSACCEGVEPEDLRALDAVALIETAAEIERLAGGARTLAAHRVVTSGIWRYQGAKSPAAWLAQRLGIGAGQAARILGVAARAARQAETADALRQGALSDEQADAVSEAAEAEPARAREHHRAARSESLAELRRRRERARAAADADEAARQARIHRTRKASRGTSLDGAYEMGLHTTKEAGARFTAAWDHHLKALQAHRRTNGETDHEGWAALAADALIRMAEHSLPHTRTGASSSSSGGSSSDSTNGDRETGESGGDDGPASSREAAGGAEVAVPAGPRAVIHATVDVTALRRGHTRTGETCEIAGVGPVPLATVRGLLGDATTTLLITRGVDVVNVCHLGATLTAAQRTAVYHRAGRRCEVPHCTSHDGLEIDHIHERHLGGPTHIDNLALLCWDHHQRKTHHHWRLIGPPGRRAWHHLDDLPADPATGAPPSAFTHLLPDATGTDPPASNTTRAGPPPNNPAPDAEQLTLTTAS